MKHTEFTCDKCGHAGLTEEDIVTVFSAPGHGEPTVVADEETYHLCVACWQWFRGKLD